MQKTVPYQLNNFQNEVLDKSQSIPVLVIYWASWCGPCKFMAPIIEKLASEAEGKSKAIFIEVKSLLLNSHIEPAILLLIDEY